MGLLEVRVGARGGAFVTIPTGSRVAQAMSDMMVMTALSPEDIVEARLDGGARHRHAGRRPRVDEDFEQLRELDTRARQALAEGTYTPALSWEFHSLLAVAAHNGAIEGLTQSFRSSLSMHPVRSREGAKAHAATVEEHARIREALERRDARRCAARDGAASPARHEPRRLASSAARLAQAVGSRRAR